MALFSYKATQIASKGKEVDKLRTNSQLQLPDSLPYAGNHRHNKLPVLWARMGEERNSNHWRVRRAGERKGEESYLLGISTLFT